MTPQNRAQAPATERARGNTTRAHAGPRKPTCAAPGCDRPRRALGYCKQHYQAAYQAGERAKQIVRPLAGTLPIRPLRPKRITDALHALAETPGLTPDQYEREKAEILRGETT